MHQKLLLKLEPYIKEQFNHKYLNTQLLPKQLEYLHKFGYHRVFEFYTPHITIGRYESRIIRDNQMHFAPQIKGEFKFDKVYLDDCIDGSHIPADILWSKVL